MGSHFRVAIGAILSASIVSSAYAFGPCSNTVPSGVSYLPSVAQCGGRAGVVLSGEFYNSFSIVLRDCNNNDRDPCNYGPSSCGSNASSPFKVQTVMNAVLKRGKRRQNARLFCLRESGHSEVYKLVRRITIKLRNPVRSDSDVAKICLSTRTSAVNPVEILSVSSPKNIGATGYSATCARQKYLACSVAYSNICPKY